MGVRRREIGMIKSMTAFARQSAAGEWGSASIEIRTVNHRYLDINMRIPENLRDLEMSVRDVIRQTLQRGKIDCTIQYTSGNTNNINLVLNQPLIQQLLQVATEVTAQMTNAAPLNAMDFLKWPGALQVNGVELSGVEPEILKLLVQTLQELEHARAREGTVLAHCIVERLDAIAAQVAKIQPRIHDVVQIQRARMAEKVSELTANLDPNRIEQEVAILAQRFDVSEELDRLKAHLNETRRIIKTGGNVGRRLDFLMQELNREANTLSSKSTDFDMTQAAVEIKVLIEQMREQIQNIE